MIGKLKGIIDSIGEDYVIIDVGGVGYLVSCSSYTQNSLAGLHKPAELLIDSYIKDEQIKLFGFASKTEQIIFRELNKVSGVGNKMALSILSTIDPQNLIIAITNQDKTMLTRAPGVGPKLAARIIVDLKDRFGKLPQSDNSISPNLDPTNNITDEQVPVNDAIAALVHLGYNRGDVAKIVNKLYKQEQISEVSKLVRAGLKELSNT